VRATHPATVVALHCDLVECSRPVVAKRGGETRVRLFCLLSFDEEDPYFVGIHTHTSFESAPQRIHSASAARHLDQINNFPDLRHAHVPHAGAFFPGLEEHPSEFPSRAYLKLEEALRWAGEMILVRSGDTALEIGSAPGGGAYALLERGLQVYGVDPSPRGREHAPVVAKYPRFTAVMARLGQPSLLERLPSEVD
jgi:hypothetical protein